MPRPLFLTLTFGAFLLGGLVGGTPYFDINDRLSAGDLLNAIVTVLVAVVLGVVFQKSFSETRVEKDLLIAHAKDVIGAAKDLRTTFLNMYDDEDVPTADQDSRLLAAVRMTSVSLSALERATKSCDVDYSDKALKEARKAFRRYRNAVTNRAHKAVPYTADEYAAAETAFAAFVDDMLMFTLRVNKR